MALINLLILLRFFFLSFEEDEICNYSFEYNTVGNYCALKKKTDSPGIFNIQINFCKGGCNIQELLYGDIEKKLMCKTKVDQEYILPSYSGGVCKNDSYCLFGVCIDGKCISSELGENCESHENCPLNSACISGKCKNLKSSGEECFSTYECKLNLFCNKIKNKCEPLFSKDDGIDITEMFSEEDIIEEICRSGGYTEENGKYICNTIFNNGTSCDKECTYLKKTNGLYISEKNCKCSYNKYRSKHCILGNGDPKYEEYLELKKKLKNNDLYSKNCHTLERNIHDFCNNLININKTVTFRKYQQEFNNKKILAKEYHRYIESDSKLLTGLYGYSTDPVIPENQKCPKVFCSSGIDECVISINPMEENGNGSYIQLNDNVCAKGELCSFIKGNYFQPNFLSEMNLRSERFDGKCKIFVGEKNKKRYPGEDCEFDSDCENDEKNNIKKECRDKKCFGFQNSESCNFTSECVVGLYCDSNSKKCIPQKDEGEKCNDWYDCKNYLGCYRGRCIKFGSLNKGMLNTAEISKFPKTSKDTIGKRALLCSTGELQRTDKDTLGKSGNYCSEYDYDEEWLNGIKKDNKEDIYVKCNPGEYCHYFDGKTKYKEKCRCGYNPEGQGYCPVPSAKIKDDYINYIKFQGQKANNDCHSINRFSCYKKLTFEYYQSEQQHLMKTTYKHYYYKAKDCVKNTFMDSKYLYFNYLFYFILIFLY